MDSRAYLQRQGWRGDGHSLDHTGNGIKKPLLVSKKVDVLGVGLNKHAAVSDQWWMRAYDQGLKDLGTGKEGALASVQKHGVNRGGLYGRFVRGEGVPGTFGEDSAGSTGDEMPVNGAHEEASRKASGKMVAEERPSKKRKREDVLGKKNARRKTAQDGQSDIDRQANEFVMEASRLGIIPTGSSEAQKSITSSLSKSAGFDEMMAKVLAKAGITGEQGSNADKYQREKTKRKIKRAAEACLLGEETGQVENRRQRKHVRQVANIAETEVVEGDSTIRGDEPVGPANTRGIDELQASARKPRNLSPEKLAEYTKRAAEKGLSVEVYIARREEKYAAKQAEKHHRQPRQQVPASEKPGLEYIATPTEPATNAVVFSAATVADRPAYVVDTIGADDSRIDLNDPTFSSRAMRLISQGLEFTVTDAAENQSFKWEPGMPIPSDPRIWAGVKPNELPKSVRKARKEWMAVRRQEKKQRELAEVADNNKDGGAVNATRGKKQKGQSKVEKREAFVRSILVKSRKVASDSGDKTATVDGVSDVPLVEVETSQGAFTKYEMSKARAVARRVLMSTKKEKRAAKMNARGHKKQERKKKKGRRG